MEEIWKLHGLTKEEYDTIVKHLGREPNEVELGILGALWSEHCSYKSSKKVLRKFPTAAEWVIQGPGENAGVVRIDDEVWVAFKVESHNHPSFIDPFNGAGTGVGGIIRDVLSMGARPVALADSLRFGELHHQDTKRIIRGVVKGISFYGNSVGIPTVAGETFFEEPYVTNPLVNAFCLGILPAGRMLRARGEPGDVLFLIGSTTGRDGIHGAVMASEEFGEGAEEKRPNVQIGDPFFEKKIIEAVLEAVDEGLVKGLQDLGAAGLAGACSEVASKSKAGVEVYLDEVPLREEGMRAYEILLSESQERMLIVTDESKVDPLKELAERYHLSYGVVGKLTEGEDFVAFFEGREVARLPVSLIVDEAPLYERPVKEPEYLKEVQSLNEDALEPVEVSYAIRKLLSSPNVCSKRWVYSQYDYQVGTNTVVKPGSDSAVLRIKWVQRPEIKTDKAIAVSCEGNGRWVYLDPYEGGKYVVAEACRNVACTGARPLAITDCLNFGNPERPEIMWQFVKAVEGMAEACKKLNVPVVGGNVSLYNETVEEGVARNVYPTPVVVCVGVLDSAEEAVDVSFKKDNDDIILIGDLSSGFSLSGSEFLKVIHSLVKGKPPKIDLEKEKILIDTLIHLVKMDLINSAHDISTGGLAVCVLESLFPTKLGATLEIYSEEREERFLFSENPTRVIISVDPSKTDLVKEIIEERGLDWMYIGKVTDDGRFRILYNGKELFDEEVNSLKTLWEKALEERI